MEPDKRCRFCTGLFAERNFSEFFVNADGRAHWICGPAGHAHGDAKPKALRPVVTREPDLDTEETIDAHEIEDAAIPEVTPRAIRKRRMTPAWSTTPRQPFDVMAIVRKRKERDAERKARRESRLSVEQIQSMDLISKGTNV